jgi:hypothetical protein
MNLFWHKLKRWPIIINILLLLWSIFAIIRLYPWNGYKIHAIGGALSLISIVLNAGWTPTLTILGAYLGFILDAHVKSGTKESQLIETIITFILCSLVGCASGLVADLSIRERVKRHSKASSIGSQIRSKEK